MRSLPSDLRHGVPGTRQSAGVHGRHRHHPGARNRRQQRHLQPRQRRAAASAGLRRSGAADDDLRDHPRVTRPTLRRVAAGLRRSRAYPAPVLGHRHVSYDGPYELSGYGRAREITVARVWHRCFRSSALAPPRVGRSWRRKIRPSGRSSSSAGRSPPPLCGLVAERRGAHDSTVGRTRSSASWRRASSSRSAGRSSTASPRSVRPARLDPVRAQEARGMMYNHSVIGRLRTA